MTLTVMTKIASRKTTTTFASRPMPKMMMISGTRATVGVA